MKALSRRIVSVFSAFWLALIAAVSLYRQSPLADQRGEMTDKIIGLAIGVMIISALVGAAVTRVAQTSQTSWDAASIALWGTLGVVIVGAVIYAIWRSVRD